MKLPEERITLETLVSALIQRRIKVQQLMDENESLKMEIERLKNHAD